MVVSALLYEHKDRGKFGYELTERFFSWFESKFPKPHYDALGPRRGGGDIELCKIFPEYRHRCPTDIVIMHEGRPVVVGFARYDSDRGGSQEDDRTGGNQSKVMQILDFVKANKVDLKILFLNEGPGLLLGSMWRDYAELESLDPMRIMVTTLKMLEPRLTASWMLEH